MKESKDSEPYVEQRTAEIVQTLLSDQHDHHQQTLSSLHSQLLQSQQQHNTCQDNLTQITLQSQQQLTAKSQLITMYQV